MQFGNLLESEPSEEIAESERPITPLRRRKRRRRGFIDPDLILEVFPDLAPDMMCALSDLENPRPSQILKLLPEASSADIKLFFNKLKGDQAKDRKGGRSASRRRSYSKPLLDELKEDLADTEDNR